MWSILPSRCSCYAFCLLLLGLPARAVEMNVPGGPGGLAAPIQLDGPDVADPIQRRGALFRVRHDGHSAYLFGTIHVGKQAFFPLEPEVTRALSDSGALVIELDIRDNLPFQQALDKHGRYPAGDSIAHHLAPATLRQLVQALAKAGLPLRTVERYKPWLVANILVGMQLEGHGLERGQGVEYFLLAAAKRQDKTVRELESADYQLALFDSLDDRQQEQYLRENLADLDSGRALRNSQSLVDAWSAADAPRMNALWRDLTSGPTISASFLQQTLLGKRNPEMASAIERIMQHDQRPFVGVGLLHLLGENSVPQLLKRRGYEVERIY